MTMYTRIIKFTAFAIALGMTVSCQDQQSQSESITVVSEPQSTTEMMETQILAFQHERQPTAEEVAQLVEARTSDPLLQFTPHYEPKYVTNSEASHLSDNDRVFGVLFNGIAKAYPGDYIAWHHVIQDDFGDTPILVTWCTLCGTGAAYINDIDGHPGQFRGNGMIGSNIQLGDLESGNSIQQATGIFIEGPLEGQSMERVNTIHASWEEWRTEHPDGLLMLPNPGDEESYAYYKPTMGIAGQRFRGSLTDDTRRPRHDLIAGLDYQGEYKAYPLTELAIQTLVNDQVGNSFVLVTFTPESKTVRIFSREVNGHSLTFNESGMGRLVDEATSSTWNASGLAIEGPMKDTQLERISPLPSFWFSWAQFYPETEVFTAHR